MGQGGLAWPMQVMFAIGTLFESVFYNSDLENWPK